MTSTIVPQALNHNRPDYTFHLPGGDYDSLWAELAAKDQAEAAQNAWARLIGPGRYLVEMIGADYLLDVPNRSVTGPLNRIPPDKRTVLCLAYYLNGAAADSFSNNMVSEKVLPGGDRFFSGTHALKRQPILDKFAGDGRGFIRTGETLGAETLSGGPDSFSFKIKLLPKIAVQVILGEEDDEFPAALSFAVDSSVVRHVSLGVLAGLVAILNEQMAAL